MIKNTIKKDIKKYLILAIISGLFLSLSTIQCTQTYAWKDLWNKIFAPKRYDSMKERPTAPLTTEFVSSTLKDPDFRSMIGEGLIGSMATGLVGMKLLSVILALPA